MKAKLNETVELRGEAWTKERFDRLKQMDADRKKQGQKSGRVAVVDSEGQVFIAPVENLEIISE